MSQVLMELDGGPTHQYDDESLLNGFSKDKLTIKIENYNQNNVILIS